MTKMAIFTEDHLLRICDVLANSATGLTGTEIGTFLLRLHMPDPGAGVSKKSRLFEAMQQRQRRNEDGHAAVAFIQAAMDPGRYVGTALIFEKRRELLNTVLAETGLFVGEDGKVQVAINPETTQDSEKRAHALMVAAEARGIHQEVSRIIGSDAMDHSHFKVALHIVLALSDRIRFVSGLTCDGTELVDRAFGGISAGRMPLVALADLMTESGRSQQASLIGLTKGILSTFRGVSGFAPRIPWELSDADLLDLAALASMLHRRLDHATRLRKSHELFGHDDPPTRLTSH